MSVKCKFELSRSSNIYYAGEEIAGSLTICSSKQSQIDAILLEFYGQSRVQWWELDKTEENIKHNDFSTREVLEKKICEYQQKHVFKQLKLNKTNNSQLQAHVEYTFGFCFPIPQQVPTTFNCKYGRTEYCLTLLMRRTKKVHQEFCQRIVIKNKLDLTKNILYKKACAVYHQNEFGQIYLEIPCSGFTPGQKIPYYLHYQKQHHNFKAVIQLNCYTTCRLKSNCKKFKQIKKIINYKKHLSSQINSYLVIPLHCPISSQDDLELIITSKYTLEAFLINGYKKVLLNAAIPLTIGTLPCYTFDEGFENYMCYNNMGSSFSDEIHRHLLNFPMNYQ